MDYCLQIKAFNQSIKVVLPCLFPQGVKKGPEIKHAYPLRQRVPYPGFSLDNAKKWPKTRSSIHPSHTLGVGSMVHYLVCVL